MLSLTQGPPVSLPPANHFGFQLESGDEVRAAREQMRAAGVPEAEWQDDGRWVRVQVLDPDGYRIDLFGY